MKTAELLRKLADVIDGNSGQYEPQAELQQVDVDNVDNTETTTMVPPLQQKIELLKKSVGVDNHFDDEEAECACQADDADDDELALIKQRAGIQPAIIVASDDEPLDM